ncbi:MAG: 3-oxoacyl-ACP reductase FabG [Firmicutes bacterium]|nr:3-oxoacyl-ACP reductase FabG [Bacillota bacterium]
MILGDKVAIVTGGGGGIGREIALRLSAEGAAIAVADIDGVAAAEVAELAASRGGRAVAVPCDVRRVEDVDELVARTLDAFGAINVLVNNAGIFPVRLFSEMTEEDWDQVMAVNLKGVFLVTRAVYGHMRRRKHGKIINIASVAGRSGVVGFVHYSTSKAGLIGFTRSLACEAAQYGIQVNAVAPGIIETDTARDTFPASALRDYVARVPAARLGRPDDVSGMVVFLASPAADYITGQALAVDGGYTMV